MASVSILIPCFNAERWIGQCIESALAQTHSDCEVVVVDDGSTDGSLEIIRSAGDKIRFESGPNRGGNQTRNRLLELAEGRWVQFLDADDYLMPGKVENQVSAADTETDAVYSRVLIEELRGDTVHCQSPSDLSLDAGLPEQWIRWQLAQTGAVLWRTESLRRIGGWNSSYPCCQDNELTMRALMEGLKFSYCESVEAVYRIWSDDTVSRKNPQRVVDVKTRLIEQMLGWLSKHGRVTESIAQAAGQVFFECARTLAASDIQLGAVYAAERRAAGHFCVDGPAAPARYRLMYRLFGFRFAEYAATLLRRR